MNKSKQAGGRKPKKKSSGRPGGSPNIKSGIIRNEIAKQFRCTEGFLKVCELLIDAGIYKSKSDIYHEAVLLLAAKKSMDNPRFDLWKNKIM